MNNTASRIDLTHDHFLCPLVSSNEIIIWPKTQINHSTFLFFLFLFSFSCAVERTIGPGTSLVFDVNPVCIHRLPHKQIWLQEVLLSRVSFLIDLSRYLIICSLLLWINQCIALITAAELFCCASCDLLVNLWDTSGFISYKTPDWLHFFWFIGGC